MSRIKTYLTAGLPSIFGFTVFGSIWDASKTGKIPYPSQRYSVEGGHAIVAVGYDDNLKTTNTVNNKTKKGAILIRNSWGLGWGQSGYGWMPYDYVLRGIAMDFWSMLKMEWVDTNQFFEN